MKAKLTLNGKEYEVEVSEEQVNEIEKPKYKRWRAEKGEGYFYIFKNGHIDKYLEENDNTDNFLYDIGNYFKTKEKAEFRQQQLLYLQQYKDYLGYDLVTKDDWKDDDILKYCVSYDYDDNPVDYDGNTVFISCNTYIKSQGTIYSKSKQKIKDFIKEIGEENFKKYILEVED